MTGGMACYVPFPLPIIQFIHKHSLEILRLITHNPWAPSCIGADNLLTDLLESNDLLGYLGMTMPKIAKAHSTHFLGNMNTVVVTADWRACILGLILPSVLAECSIPPRWHQFSSLNCLSPYRTLLSDQAHLGHNPTYSTLKLPSSCFIIIIWTRVSPFLGNFKAKGCISLYTMWMFSFPQRFCFNIKSMLLA